MAKEEKKIEGFCPEYLLSIGEKDCKFESPIALSLDLTTEVSLPNLQWNYAKDKPRLMKITNSGESVILSAKWFNPRPFLTKGPFLDCYVFSQIHFHWGKDNYEGSEHKVDDVFLPMEIHMTFFKSLYLSQEEALKKLDGVAILAYFVKLHDQDNERLKPIIEALEKIRHPFTSHHMDPISLDQLMPLFNEDYFLYWGNVAHKDKILWMLCRQPLTISPKQLSKFRNLLDKQRNLMLHKFRDIKSLNYRKIFHVNPGHEKKHFLYVLPHEIEAATATTAVNTDEPKLNTGSRKSMKKKSIKPKKSIRKQSTKRKSSVKKKKSIQAHYVTIERQENPFNEKLKNEDEPYAREDQKRIDMYNGQCMGLENILKNVQNNNNISPYLIDKAKVTKFGPNVPLREQVEDFLIYFKKAILSKNKSEENILRNVSSTPVFETYQKISPLIIKEEEIINSEETIKPRKVSVRPITAQPNLTINLIRPSLERIIKRSLERKALNNPRSLIKDIFDPNLNPNPLPRVYSPIKIKKEVIKPKWRY